MRTSLDADISVTACESDGLLLEQYAYTAGAVEPIPKHSHEAYQFALSYDCPGEYRYRGEWHHIPTGHLSVVHAGEVHAPSDCPFLDEPAHFSMAHIHPKWIDAVSSEVLQYGNSEPFFSFVLPIDTFLNRLFLGLSSVSGTNSSQLEKDVALWNFLSCLIGRYAQERSVLRSLKSSREAILMARDYLRDRYRDDISLDELAAVAGLSRFHFCRLFHAEVGVSVSVYQMQLRLAQAKRLLVQGMSISESAISTGFYDQSHFGKNFKRHVGTTPAKYVRRVAVSSYNCAEKVSD